MTDFVNSGLGGGCFCLVELCFELPLAEQKKKSAEIHFFLSIFLHFFPHNRASRMPQFMLFLLKISPWENKWVPMGLLHTNKWPEFPWENMKFF